MASSRKKGIRRSIEQNLFPELLARGFVHVPDSNDPQLAPFGRFLRRTDRGVDIVVLHFNKNRTSHFHFQVARATRPEMFLGGTLEPDEQRPFHVRPNFTIWRRGLVFRRWFGVAKYARKGITDQEYDAAVVVAVRHLKVIERVLETGRRSMYVEEFPQQGLRADLAYWTLCALSVLIPFYAALWLLGWIWRHL